VKTAGNSPLKLPLVKPRIVVKKSQRQLLLFSEDRLVRTYHVGLGLNPSGDKVKEGDRRTPEGDFYIFTKNDKSAFYLSLGISYPNAAHAQRGVRDGLITRGEYDAIVRALRSGKALP
jgi:murein L,D-transpeptidase YafK